MLAHAVYLNGSQSLIPFGFDRVLVYPDRYCLFYGSIPSGEVLRIFFDHFVCDGEEIDFFNPPEGLSVGFVYET